MILEKNESKLIQISSSESEKGVEEKVKKEVKKEVKKKVKDWIFERKRKAWFKKRDDIG